MPLQATSGAASYDAFGGGVPVVPAYIEEVFSTYLYTGTGAAQTITNGIELSSKGGLVWLKGSWSSNHILVDTIRSSAYKLSSDTTSGQSATSGLFSSFNSNGFSLGADTSSGDYNWNTIKYVSWTFREQPKFFDVVTWTGNSTARTIAHNLGSVPGCIMVKAYGNMGSIGGASAWNVYHRSLGNTKSLFLNSTTSEQTSSTYWNNTSPTSTVFTVGTDSEVNANAVQYVAYIFAHDAGGFGLLGTDNVISCGSFTTNGSGNATVSLGYEPQWVLIKQTDGVDSWYLNDNMRGMAVSGNQPNLSPNSSAAESAGGYNTYPNATGFTASVGIASKTYIYIAIRRPMKVPTSGTSVFSPVAYTGNGTAGRSITAGFPVDLAIGLQRTPANGSDRFFVNRLVGATKGLVSWNTVSEATDANSLTGFDSMTGVTVGTDTTDRGFNGNGRSLSPYFFKRAPSFMDVVCWSIDNSTITVNHNLGVVPEMIIYKGRNIGFGWYVYHSAMAVTDGVVLSSTIAKNTYGTYWNDTAPTASVFTSGSTLGGPSTYIAYLFATCAGVSKVGSYTGTATTLQIDCGFTGGARFVLIKRTDSTGAWYVWDTARGIVSGNDPYLLLNSTAAEVTNTDYIDTYSAGFEISSTAPDAINASGGSFIFLAIA